MVTTDVMAERRRQPTRRRLVTLLGPAFVAAVAYVDPGNVAANVTAGARYGYLLVWVLVAANVMAVLIQYLSAKFGVVSGNSLAGEVGVRLPRAGRLAYWAQAEVVAGATDLAEIVGGAIALRILFGVPLLPGGVVITLVSIALLAVQSSGRRRPFELLIMGLLAIITIGFVSGLTVADVSVSGMASGLVPRLDGSESVLLAAGMLGATVMPHAIYLHSDLARDRHGTTRDTNRVRRLLRATRWDVTVALVVAGSVNIAMLVLAASSLPGAPGTDTLDGAHHAIGEALGPAVAAVFAVGLLVSGLASTAVGCYAGASIMESLVRVRVPLMARRAITALPALIVLALTTDPTWALILSQVVLSLGIPCAVIPLAWFTSRRAIMGPFRNGAALNVAVIVATSAIVTLNLLLVYLAFFR